ncbi:MAG: DUF445 domain-containing protein [Bacteroidetes bacterium]|nr:DUF445 domain-containing protein [Bacteroidota bacterium]
MSNTRILAPVSLALATALFLVTLPLRDVFVWGLLHAFAEASMIGGLADWFAVVALFRHPLGIPIPHTAIILRHRAKITGAIIDMVQNRWLAKDAIRERIEGWNFSGMLLGTLETEENRERLLEGVQSVLKEIVRDFDEKRSAAYLTQIIARHVQGDDLLRWVRLAGRQGMAQGWHRNLFSHSIGYAAGWLNTPEIRAAIIHHLRDIAEQYASNPLRRIGIWLAENTNTLNYEELAEAIVRTIEDELARMRDEKDHPARTDFELWLKRMIDGLETNTELRTNLERWRHELLYSGRATELLERPVRRLRDWLLEDLEEKDSLVMQQLRTSLERGLQKFMENKAAQESLDHWLKEKIAALVEQHHGEIGAMVQRNLEKLDDKQMVRQIEEKVGGDLQYIRVNGAIVGGLVGACIFLLKYYVFP